jgi:adenine-specific DNA-methyltransferase
LELRNTHREFGKFNRPNLHYPIYVNPDNQNVKLEPDDSFNIKVLPDWSDGFEGCWTWGSDLANKDKHLLLGRKIKGEWKIYRKSYASNADGDNVKKKLFTILQDPKFYTEKGQSTFGEIFPGFSKTDFPQPKSVDLIAQLLLTYTTDSDIILDSFAGSGTTGHATLLVNKDGKNRSFIMIEREDYADSITAERMRRVINGYGSVDGLTGGFNYFILGNRLFDEHNELNEEISVEEIREYIYYTETKQNINSVVKSDKSNNKYFLGFHEGTDYYFIYEKHQTTTLNPQFLKTIRNSESNKIIYADNCLLSKELLIKNNIIFKKIPRDITKF